MSRAGCLPVIPSGHSSQNTSAPGAGDALGNEYLFGFIQLVNLPVTFGNWLAGLPRLVFEARSFAPVGVDLSWYYLVLPLHALPPLILWGGSRRRVLHGSA